MYVDGVQRNRKNGVAGTIDNNFPMTVGGKIDCDQVNVTCDYFSGQIDFIKISKGGNLPPTPASPRRAPGRPARSTPRRRTTPTAAITSYAWAFGDGGTSTAANPSHTYAAAGTYTVTLR